MNDEQLRSEFAKLREAERTTVPAFRVPVRGQSSLRLAYAAALLLIMISIVWVARLRRPEPTISATSISSWHAPTDFLLVTPGHELLTSTPNLKPEIP